MSKRVKNAKGKLKNKYNAQYKREQAAQRFNQRLAYEAKFN